MFGPEILSKVCDENDTEAFTRYAIDATMFATDSERQAFTFINDYASANGGKAPSADLVAAEVPEFAAIYIPHVSDGFPWLVERFKDAAGKRALQSLFATKAPEDWLNEKSAEETIELLTKHLDKIKMRTCVRQEVGTNVKTDTDKFIEEYERRKSGDSFKMWKSAFPRINREVGGYVSGNVYTIYGRSGRGKSVIAIEEAVGMAMQGANVLIWSMEMGWFEVLVRIYVSLSARQKITKVELDGATMAAGFNAADVRAGKLGDDFEEGFRDFLKHMNELMPGSITVRSVDDDDFNKRDLRALESDILATKADVVVVDPFYYLDYERNTSKTAGGDAAATSIALRRLTGRMHVVTFPITQADESKDDKTDEGERELKQPQRADVKKTKQLLEDAYMLITVDTDYKQRRGYIWLNKGRDGGEGTEIELSYIPSVGIVREMPSGEEIAGEFTLPF
jgi:replicative DNA helicase